MTNSQERLKKQISTLPNTPGVYKFLGNKNQILYIGKATSLKSRVRSYLTKDLIEKRSPIIAKMIMEAKCIKFEQTDSVLEALLLESSLIKKLNPPYNTAEKDQKSFNYVVITKENFPRVLMVRERIIHNSPFIIQSSFGPFPHSSELKEALKIVRKIFPFRDKCNPPQQSLKQTEYFSAEKSLHSHASRIPRVAFENVAPESSKPCFNYQIGLCPGVCVGKVSEKEYKKTIAHLKTFFEGNKKKLIKDLEKEMQDLSKKREFEKASGIKKKIFALKHIQDVALIKREKVVSSQQLVVRIEAYDIAHISGTSMVGVMTVVEDGEVNKNEYRKFKIKGQSGANDTKALKEILERRLQHTEWLFPNLIVVDGGVAQLNTAETIIKNLNLKIPTVAVTKDERHKAKEIKSTNTKSKIVAEKYKNQILLANSESHRFALSFHRKLRSKIS